MAPKLSKKEQQENEARALNRIKAYIKDHRFVRQSEEEKNWFRVGYQSGEFSADNLIEAGVYAFTKADAAVRECDTSRELARVPRPANITAHFADVQGGDLNKENTLLLEDNRMLVDPDVVRDKRHLRTIAAWGKAYHRAMEENARLQNEIRLMGLVEAWFYNPNRQRDRICRTGPDSYQLHHPSYTGRILKEKVLEFQEAITRDVNMFEGLVQTVHRDFKQGRIVIPDLRMRVFNVEPRADPDLHYMEEGSIRAYDLSPALPDDSSEERTRKRQLRERFLQSLAILAWNCAQIQKATMDLGDRIHAARGR